MKKFKIQNVSGAILYAILIITLVILGMFFFGGETPMADRVVADPSLSEPLHTDALIYWMYILFVIVIVATLVAAIYKFGANLKDSPKSAMKSLMGLVLMVVVLMFSWSIGSGEALVIPGYEGTENVPFWLKITDMFLYTLYIEVGAMILLMIGFGVAKKLK